MTSKDSKLRQFKTQNGLITMKEAFIFIKILFIKAEQRKHSVVGGESTMNECIVALGLRLECSTSHTPFVPSKINMAVLKRQATSNTGNTTEPT